MPARYLLLGLLLLGGLTTTTKGQSLKVMTYNIRLDFAGDGEDAWLHRRDKLVAQIQFYAPAIMGIQEALPHQVTELAAGLPGYAYVGQARDGEGKGESSNIFYDQERLTILENHTFWLSATPDTVSRGWDAACNRVCTYARFHDQGSSRQFWVFNTHLDHVGQEARARSVALIRAKIKEVNTGDDPVIFMGDLNAEPASELIAEVRKDLVDTRERSVAPPFGPVGTFNGFQFCEPVTRRIDYIFISPTASWVVKRYAVLSDSDNLHYPSDHLPVLVELSTVTH
ncbi:MAG: endonuclease/exonuclease/phosphatase [Bacteroidetes bacterium]|nr:MAG: endonuclease/exonuclease/phosphatase [Bacteroidota bacterium]PTM13269.1 MAG: endonuclease/exonuclease/phosphatase [Bacteroidota bacterium]